MLPLSEGAVEAACKAQCESEGTVPPWEEIGYEDKETSRLHMDAALQAALLAEGFEVERGPFREQPGWGGSLMLRDMNQTRLVSPWRTP